MIWRQRLLGYDNSLKLVKLSGKVSHVAEAFDLA